MNQQESSVGTTHINNGFQPGEKEERRKKKVPYERQILTTGFEPGE